MKIEEHIKNLEEYCQEDELFEKDGDFKEFCDNHIADIKAVINELKNTQADLYEANHRITDLLLTLGDRDRMINTMVDTFLENDNWWYLFENNRESVIKYFEERCKNAKD